MVWWLCILHIRLEFLDPIIPKQNKSHSMNVWQLPCFREMWSQFINHANFSIIDKHDKTSSILWLSGNSYSMENDGHNLLISIIYKHGRTRVIFWIIECLATPISLSMMTSSNRNIFRVTGPLWEESIGDRWVPFTKANDGALMFSLICV